MPARPATFVAAHRCRTPRALLVVLVLVAGAVLLGLAGRARGQGDDSLTLNTAFVVEPEWDGNAPANALRPVALPDDWAVTRPRHEGSVWYRARFDRPGVPGTSDLVALYVERACSNLEVYLNERLVYSGGRMADPVAAACRYPHLVACPRRCCSRRATCSTSTSRATRCSAWPPASSRAGSRHCASARRPSSRARPPGACSGTSPGCSSVPRS
jgi:hypothetical protein